MKQYQKVGYLVDKIVIGSWGETAEEVMERLKNGKDAEAVVQEAIANGINVVLVAHTILGLLGGVDNFIFFIYYYVSFAVGS